MPDQTRLLPRLQTSELKGVLRGGGVASEASWITGTLKGSAIGALDSSDGGFRLAELEPEAFLADVKRGNHWVFRSLCGRVL